MKTALRREETLKLHALSYVWLSILVRDTDLHLVNVRYFGGRHYGLLRDPTGNEARFCLYPALVHCIEGDVVRVPTPKSIFEDVRHLSRLSHSPVVFFTVCLRKPFGEKVSLSNGAPEDLGRGYWTFLEPSFAAKACPAIRILTNQTLTPQSLPKLVRAIEQYKTTRARA